MSACERAAYEAWLAQLMRHAMFRSWLNVRGLHAWTLLRGTWERERAGFPPYQRCGEPGYAHM